VEAQFDISNEDRAVGTLLSNEISKLQMKEVVRRGQLLRPDEQVPDGGMHVRFKGTAGQSFCAFGARGITFELEGDANDYFGKGLSGARVVIYPDKRSTFRASDNSIVGNVALYGATSGEVFICGRAGERFGVRNSGVTAVVEGIGDHGCEYMTGGTVVILGGIGRNFGAGMSGGTAYLFDPDKKIEENLNKEIGPLEPLNEADVVIVRNLIETHQALTGSKLAQDLLAHWDEVVSSFVKFVPEEYRVALQKKAIVQPAAVESKTS
jgi:glutamate synthase (NADPH/NADH) large chain